MKIGIAISALIVAVVAGLLLLNLREEVDEATDATRDANLEPMRFADNLPVVFVVAGGGDPEAADDAFAALLAATDRVGPVVTGGAETDKLQSAGVVCDALVAAVDAGPWTDGFIDGRIDPGGVFTDPLRRQFRIISLSADLYGAWLIEGERYAEADRLARARFELGRRVFVQNIRLRGRQRGLSLVRTGLTQLVQTAQLREKAGQSAPTDTQRVADAATAWEAALGEIEAVWKAKLEAISSAKPNIADLVRVAEHDEDRSFRVFATHQLGYARYERTEPGNQKLIAAAIERARQSDDPLVAAAGRSAAEMTREQFHTSER